MSREVLPPNTYGIQPGEYIFIKYPIIHNKNTIVIFSSRGNINYVYDVCRDDDPLYNDYIKLDYPLGSCSPKYNNASITLRILGSGPHNNPTKIERITTFTRK